MAKNFTKYSVDGIEKGLGKARLVQKIVAHYADKNQMRHDDLKEVWFDDLQGGKGVFKKLAEIDQKIVDLRTLV